jgi:hypothetical protein
MKPHTRYVFEDIERLEKTTDMCGMGMINETGWLLTIDNFIEMVVKKSIFYAELMDMPRVRESK